jgi:hypothetical protein
MKSNRSLAISTKIMEYQKSNMLGIIEKEFPKDILLKPEFSSKRTRIFTPSSTLLTMILTAIQKDKTLKNSVDLYYTIHQNNRAEIEKELKMHNDEEARKQTGKPKTGRPRKKTLQIQKSQMNDISLNTAAYSKARTRLPIELTLELFEKSLIGNVKNKYSHFHGYRVLIADGTYVQMQDSPELRKKYKVFQDGKENSIYPQGLLEAVTERGSGQIYSFKLASRQESELSLFFELIDQLPSGSILLLDDLYNCYEIIAKCLKNNIQIVVPAKRKRNSITKRTITEGDEIIEIKTPKVRSKWLKQPGTIPDTIELRKITCKSPDGGEYILNTTVLSEEIGKDEIQTLFLTRWDIEISLREIKTIMDINILRSKTPEMVLKELTVALAAYNLIRKMIYASIKDLLFSPEEDFIYKFYTLNSDILIDKKGRVYQRWSTGRKRIRETN